MKDALWCHDHDMKVNERTFFMVQCSCGSTENWEILEFYCKFKSYTILYKSTRRLLLTLFTSQTDDVWPFFLGFLHWLIKQCNLRWKDSILLWFLKPNKSIDYLKDLYGIYFLFIFESIWPQQPQTTIKCVVSHNKQVLVWRLESR